MAKPRRMPHDRNHILAALPRSDYRRVASKLEPAPFGKRRPLHEADKPISYVYFPRTGVASVVARMAEGGTIEVATIGNEGVTGIAIFFGDTSEPSETVVQVPGEGRLLPAEIFQAELARRGALHRLIGHYAHALMIQVMQSAACNALHSIEERCARWLLATQDRLGRDELPLTQEFLAQMIGVRRASVTIAALAAPSQTDAAAMATAVASRKRRKCPRRRFASSGM